MQLACRLILSSVLLAAVQFCRPPISQAASANIPAADAPRRCAPAPLREDMWQDLDDDETCHVVQFRRVPDTVPPVFYQLQAYGPAGSPDSGRVGIVLFTSSADKATLASLGGWSGSAAAIDVPRIVRTSQGSILLLAMSAIASAHPTYDVIFRVLKGRWMQVASRAWLDGIHPPAQASQRNGNAMDWRSLRAYGAFWRSDDAECCPTGGSYIAKLRLDGARLRLNSVHYSRGALDFP